MDPNVLFAGVRFDQKKSGAEVQRFKRKAEDLVMGGNLPLSCSKSLAESKFDESDATEVRTPETKSGRRSKKRK
ncbi:hypothetical protein R1sor_021411 [Riccia sorocarpa]|uniref:Uncharacterized protein n=1 Tax=Riccia sorocarpa TaxID=122646 RepID=A0ABD3GK48_9MARC